MTAADNYDLPGVELETRNQVFIRPHKVAAIMAIKEAGPTRLIFDGGGTLDVCGSAQIWRRTIRLLQLQAEWVS